MRFSAEVAAIAAAMGRVRTAVPRKDPRETMRTFRVDAADGAVHIMATDLSTGSRVSVPARVDVPGTVLLPWERALRTFQEAPPGPAEFRREPGSSGADLEAGGFKARLGIMTGEGGSEPPFPNAAEQVQRSALVDTLARTSWAACNDGIRRGLMQIRLGPPYAVASDGAVTVLVDPAPGLPPCSIPSSVVTDLARFLKSAASDTLSVVATGDRVVFTAGGDRFWCRPGPASFPDVEKVLRVTREADQQCAVPAAELLASTERVTTATGGRFVIVRADRDRIRVSAEDGSGCTAAESVPVRGPSEPAVLIFPAPNLVGALRSVGSTEVIFHWAIRPNVPVRMDAGSVRVLLLRAPGVTAQNTAEEEQ